MRALDNFTFGRAVNTGRKRASAGERVQAKGPYRWTQGPELALTSCSANHHLIINKPTVTYW